MTSSMQNGTTLVPVTALAAASNLIFAGSGPDLKIYRDDESAEELGSIRVFESQALHGIVVGVCSHGSLPVLIWGGRCVRALRIAVGPNAGSWGFSIGDVKLSNVIQLVDWILSAVIEPRLTDLSDAWDGASPTAVVITAHNSLILIRHGARLTVQSPLAKSSLEIESCQVTPGSRTILYSAFLLWPTASRTIAACGTAFGELLIWSYEWNLTGGQEITHHVFQAHEGSVFGVHISNRVVLAPGEPGVRFLASCSDDRTIRVWDIGNVDEEEPGSTTLADVYGMAARQTGFQTPQRSNTGIPQKLTHLAMTMGHDSRIWSVSFIDDAGLKDTHSKSARLVSCGEDGTCRLWDLVAQRERVSEDTRVTYDIRNSEKLLNHSGKNIWSSALSTKQCGNVGSIITGGADGAIISAVLPPHQVLGHGQHSFPETSSWSLSEVYTVAGNLREVEVPDKRDCFRSYAFLNDDQLLVTTNSGAVLVSRPHTDGLRKWTCLAVIAELKGYSTVTNGEGSSLAFIAGGKGHVYAVDAVAGTTTQLIVFEHKVATVFVLDVEDPKSGQDGQPGEDSIRLLITFIAGQAPCLMVVQRRYGSKPSLLQQVALSSDDVGISGHVITSAFLIKNYHHNILFLGTRNGTILALGVSVQPGDALYGKANLLSLVDQIHGQESVTGLRWLHGDDDQASLGYLFSVGRDGALAVHVVVMPSSGEATLTLVHKLVLPFGPNIEGLLINGPADELLVYGFHSTKFILYNVNMMREITTINCGGAHRNWALSAYRSKQFGKIQCGLFAWTQAGVLNIYSSTAPASRSIRSGGHGRDIKACAIAANPLKRSSKNIMIATGAEDTNIGLFHYESNVKGGMFRCVAVLRKHLTGIQSLKWSSDNSYLFSSGGFEEFFIWKVRPVPCLGVGIVLESACPVEDAGSEQRITAFAVAEIDHPVGDGLKKAFVISMVYSNSSIKIWQYQSDGSNGGWKLLAQATYTASCLTQAVHLRSNHVLHLLTAGTDGCIALWSPTPIQLSEGGSPSKLQIIKAVRIHQNAIKSISAVMMDDERSLVATGGDDGGLGLTLFRVPTEKDSIISSASFKLARAHAASVTACGILDDRSGRLVCNSNTLTVRVITASNDQKAKAWTVSLDADKHVSNVRRVSKAGSCIVAVADVSDLAVARIEDRLRVVVVGVGMELLDVGGVFQS